MDAGQLEKIRTIQKRDHRPKVMAAQFAQGGDRTLIYGTHINDEGWKDTFHVYLKDGRLHRFIYRKSTLGVITVVAYESAVSMHGHDMIPSKRIYWEHSDFEACWFLAVLDLPMSFTSNSWPGHPAEDRGQWAGIVYDPEEHTTREPQSTANRL